ncbi:MAG: hypothetical protein H8E66_03770 [Planctomycetes bacterium]|nr:hypothetical protein [Planctomycetota bacterium]
MAFETGLITVPRSEQAHLTDEVQRVGFTDDMSFLMSGTFTLTFDSQTTSSISYNATAATVQTSLEALSNIDAGEVVVTKTQDGTGTQEWKLTFSGDLAGTNVAQTTVDSTSVMGMGTISDIEATDTAGGSTNDEVQTVTLSNADNGTFRLAFEGETAAELADDATAAQVETALEDLNSVNNVTVTGSAGGPWTVTFVGTHSGNDLAQMNGDAAALTSGTEVREITYTYDAGSQLTDVSDPDSTYAYTYDDLGRLLTVDNYDTSGVPNVILTSAYDANSNRTSLSAEIDSTDDFLNSYTYDALNRLTRLDQDEQTGGNTVVEKRVDFSYNSIGLFTEIARFNDTDGNSGDEIATSTYTYDTLGHLTDLEYENGGTDLFTPYEWSFDNMNRVTQFIGADGTTDYTYDKTSQLTDAGHTFQSDETYTYDANGNRTMTGYTTGDNNQLTNDSTYSYEYDDEGNRTKRTDDTTFEETHYEWDFRNRLTKVTEKDDMGSTTKVVEFTYDVFSRRIAKAVDSTSPFTMTDAAIERYVYDDLNGVTSFDGGNVVLDFVDPDGTGSTSIALEHRYLYGNAVDQILAQEDDTTASTSADRVLWHLADNLGTVRDLAKNDGTLGEHYKYDSYGQIAAGDTSVTRYLYTSREYDPDTGLQYNRARWYDANSGQWISEDPLGFEGGDTNLVRYVGNGVANQVDPSGLQSVAPIPGGGTSLFDANGKFVGILFPDGSITYVNPKMTPLPPVTSPSFAPPKNSSNIFFAPVKPIQMVIPNSTVLLPTNIPGPPLQPINTNNLYLPTTPTPAAPFSPSWLLQLAKGKSVQIPLPGPQTATINVASPISMPSAGVLMQNLNAGTFPIPTIGAGGVTFEIIPPGSGPLPKLQNIQKPWDTGANLQLPLSALQSEAIKIAKEQMKKAIEDADIE